MNMDNGPFTPTLNWTNTRTIAWMTTKFSIEVKEKFFLKGGLVHVPIPAWTIMMIPQQKK